MGHRQVSAEGPPPAFGARGTVSNPDTDNGLRMKDDIYFGMGAQPHLEVQTEFETSGILAGRVGNRDGDSACRIDDGDALPCPQEREQVVDERRVAEMDVHGAAVMALPTPGTLSECGRVRPSLQDHNGGTQGIAARWFGGRAAPSGLGAARDLPSCPLSLIL